MKDKLPQLEAVLEVGLGGACVLAGGHREVGLPPLPLPQDSCPTADPELEPHSVRVELARLEQTSSPLWDSPMAWCSLAKSSRN